MLLDVATVAGSEGRERSQAIFRGLGGQVVTRLPRADKALALYERVKASAAEGMRQGRPEPEPEEVIVRPGRQPIRPPPDDPGKPGGG